MEPVYSIQRWPLGWVFVGPQGSCGIPANALTECEKLFSVDSIIDPGICHHLIYGRGVNAVMCVATESNAIKWRRLIVEELKNLPAELRWWQGVEVGKSSATIFASFCSQTTAYEVKDYSNGAIPYDGGDFERCQRLLRLFPEWRSRLDKVAKDNPNTDWPVIISNWDKIEASEEKAETIRLILKKTTGPAA